MKNKVSKNKKTLWKIPPMVWVGYLLVVTMVVTAVTFSGYVSRTAGGDTARVAKFQVTENISVTQTTTFMEMYPGKEDRWNFEIENESEVKLKSKITLSSTNNLPLTFSVVYGNDEIPLEEDTETEFLSMNPKQGAGAVSSGKDLYIKAVWEKGDMEWDVAAAERYMYEADAVSVTIQTEQIN